jgi:hypothetical protein
VLFWNVRYTTNPRWRQNLYISLLLKFWKNWELKRNRLVIGSNDSIWSSDSANVASQSSACSSDAEIQPCLQDSVFNDDSSVSTVFFKIFNMFCVHLARPHNVLTA